jgi:hypothetical protein
MAAPTQNASRKRKAAHPTANKTKKKLLDLLKRKPFFPLRELQCLVDYLGKDTVNIIGEYSAAETFLSAYDAQDPAFWNHVCKNSPQNWDDTRPNYFALVRDSNVECPLALLTLQMERGDWHLWLRCTFLDGLRGAFQTLQAKFPEMGVDMLRFNMGIGIAQHDKPEESWIWTGPNVGYCKNEKNSFPFIPWICRVCCALGVTMILPLSHKYHYDSSTLMRSFTQKQMRVSSVVPDLGPDLRYFVWD